ncbi:hypothetical protein MASR2M69_06850 [Bacteroidota bacterium]
MYGKTRKQVKLKASDTEIINIICESLKVRTTPFPTKNLLIDITSKFERQNLFDSYDDRFEDPEITPFDKIKISRLISKLITDGKISINFFDGFYSGNGFELFYNED